METSLESSSINLMAILNAFDSPTKIMRGESHDLRPFPLDEEAVSYPKMFRLKQSFAGPKIADVPAEVRKQLANLQLQNKIQPGQRVAITAGSRGINNIFQIIKAVVDFVIELDAQPFIVPAMGSHGGATAEGQIDVLRTYNITEETCGCPILSSMETVVVCKAPEGFDVHFDKNAFEADHVIVCGRIKPHTDFKGEIQSGLMKMMLIGLGKHAGASIYHRAFKDYSFDQISRSVSAEVIKNCRIAAGLAIIENGYEETALLEAVAPDKIQTREPDLLKMAAEWMARLPFEKIDVLIIEQIGKNISGTGMDTNVVGRKTNENAAVEHEFPKIKKIVVLGLTNVTHGNATGIGCADYTTQHVLDEMDYEKTRVNCVTSGRTAVGMIPIYFPTDQQTIEASLSNVGLVPSEKARVVRIKNTLDLETIECSEAFFDEVNQNPHLEILSEPKTLAFDQSGQIK